MSNPKDYFPKNSIVIYAVLDWGLGHATRSIPIIDELLYLGNKVIIASDGAALEYLKQRFPQLPSANLPGYKMRYPFSSIILNLLWQFYKPIKAIYTEHQSIKELSQKYRADIIVSDNRYGCFVKGKKNILVTHQLAPFHSLNFVRQCFLKTSMWLVQKFDEIWVPDDENIKLSGDLSYNPSARPITRFLGLYSRFLPCSQVEEEGITFLLSGPEPQRSKFENKLVQLAFRHQHLPITLVRGSLTAPSIKDYPSNLVIIPLAESQLLNDLLCRSKLIICRSGYSTLMDLWILNKKAIVVPTPGQTEQEYLAQLHRDRWPSIKQSELDFFDLSRHLAHNGHSM